MKCVQIQFRPLKCQKFFSCCVGGKGWIKIGIWKLKGKSWSILCLITCKIPDQTDQLHCIWLALAEEKLLPVLQAAAPDVHWQPIHCPMQHCSSSVYKQQNAESVTGIGGQHQWITNACHWLWAPQSQSLSLAGITGAWALIICTHTWALSICTHTHTHTHERYCRNALDHALC